MLKLKFKYTLVSLSVIVLLYVLFVFIFVAHGPLDNHLYWALFTTITIVVFFTFFLIM